MNDTALAPRHILYDGPRSRGRIVRWMLAETEQPYQLNVVDLSKSEQKTPQFLELNPMGKVPVLVSGGVIISETAAIVATLADLYPEYRLAPPAGTPERAAWYRWLFFGAGCLEPAVVDHMLERPAPERPGALGHGLLSDVLRTLRVEVSHRTYLAGDRFTAADLYVGALLAWGSMMGVGPIRDEPALKAYIERVTGRPAFAAAMTA